MGTITVPSKGGGLNTPVYIQVSGSWSRSDASGAVRFYTMKDFVKNFSKVTLIQMSTGSSVGWKTDLGNNDDPKWTGQPWATTYANSGSLTLNGSVNLTNLTIDHNMYFAMSAPVSGNAGGSFTLKFE